MVNKKRLRLKYFIPTLLIPVIIVPTVTSCSSISNTTVVAINKDNWNNGSISYLTSQTTNTSILKAAYGANYNNGNYVFFWGSLADEDIRSFLYGKSDATLSLPIEENDFSNSTFFNTFFNNSALVDNSFGFTVSFIMYLDVPTQDDQANTDVNALSGYDLPHDQYSQEEVLNIANEGAETGEYEIEDLPVEYQLMIGNYKRSDQNAITYRKLTNYIQTLRPNLTTSAEDGGIIAFKKDKNPTSYSISDSIVSDLISYYTPTADDD